MDHSKTINDLMPCDKSGDFLAVWVEAFTFTEDGTFLAVLSPGPVKHGWLSDAEATIAALEALPEHARPQYLVEAAS